MICGKNIIKKGDKKMKLNNNQLIESLAKFKNNQRMITCHNIKTNKGNIVPIGTEVQIKKIRFTKIFSEIFTPKVKDYNIKNTRIYPDTFEYICSCDNNTLIVKEYELVPLDESYLLSEKELMYIYKNRKKSALRQIEKRDNHDGMIAIFIAFISFLATFILSSELAKTDNMNTFCDSIAIAIAVSLVIMGLKYATTHSITNK